jgi:hypothetical protein
MVAHRCHHDVNADFTQFTLTSTVTSQTEKDCARVLLDASVVWVTATARNDGLYATQLRNLDSMSTVGSQSSQYPAGIFLNPCMGFVIEHCWSKDKITLD